MMHTLEVLIVVILYSRWMLWGSWNSLRVSVWWTTIDPPPPSISELWGPHLQGLRPLSTTCDLSYNECKILVLTFYLSMWSLTTVRKSSQKIIAFNKWQKSGFPWRYGCPLAVVCFSLLPPYITTRPFPIVCLKHQSSTVPSISILFWYLHTLTGKRWYLGCRELILSFAMFFNKCCLFFQLIYSSET